MLLSLNISVIFATDIEYVEVICQRVYISTISNIRKHLKDINREISTIYLISRANIDELFSSDISSHKIIYGSHCLSYEKIDIINSVQENNTHIY